MNRIKIAACCLALAAGLVSGASASLFASCAPTSANVAALSTNSPRKFTVTAFTTCSAGDLNSCCWHEKVTILRQIFGGNWQLVSGTTKVRSFQPCNGQTETVTDYPIGSAGTFAIAVDITDCNESVTLGHTSLQHTFP